MRESVGHRGGAREKPVALTRQIQPRLEDI
jgi:hypothetical protein